MTTLLVYRIHAYQNDFFLNNNCSEKGLLLLYWSILA